jgi:phosphohistidine phosphatase
MELLLWRHAEAEAGEPDLGRVLTSKGQKQAIRIAEWLERNLPGNCRVLVSPAERAQQTVAALPRKARIVEELAPNRGVSELLHAAGWPTARETVLVVGHQPTLGEVASLLIAGSSQGWVVRKGAVWWIGSRTRDGVPQTFLRAVANPDLI